MREYLIMKDCTIFNTFPQASPAFLATQDPLGNEPGTTYARCALDIKCVASRLPERLAANLEALFASEGLGFESQTKRFVRGRGEATLLVCRFVLDMSSRCRTLCGRRKNRHGCFFFFSGF